MTTTPLDQTTDSLERMQKFDASVLVRESDLGRKAFYDAIKPAQRLIDLYKRLSPLALQDFPDGILANVKQRADADYQLFQQVIQFDVDSTTAQRDHLIAQITASYEPSFTTLNALIAYSLHRSADFQRLDTEARATLQSINDQAAKLTGGLEAAQTDAVRIVEEVKAAAALAGVSQQALHFKTAADDHETEAKNWQSLTRRMAMATGGFAFISLFFHQVAWLSPSNTYEAAQLAVGKVLIFGVLSFLLLLAARNFQAHRHNAVVNRHRQQALQTYQALVDAAMDTANRDIVLTHAAACIFGPQPTGYSSDNSASAPSAKSVVELLGAGLPKST